MLDKSRTYFSILHAKRTTPWCIVATAPPKRVQVKTYELDKQQKPRRIRMLQITNLPLSDANLLVSARGNLGLLYSFTANLGANKCCISRRDFYVLCHHRTHAN